MPKSQRFQHPRIALWEGRMTVEVFEPDRGQNAADNCHEPENFSQRGGALGEALGKKGGHDVETNVTEMHQPGPDHQGNHDREAQLEIDAEERQKWEKEMAENNQHSEIPPRSCFALGVPKRFLRHVRIPDDEVLRKMDVSVENRESKPKHADVEELPLACHLRQRPRPFED